MNFKYTLGSIFLIFPLFIHAQFVSEKIEVGKNFIIENIESLNLLEGDINSIKVTDSYVTKHNGVTHVYFTQHFQDIPVYNAIFNVNITRDDQVIHYGNRFVSDLASRVNTSQPELLPEHAIRNIEVDLGIKTDQAPVMMKKVSDKSFLFQETEYTSAPIPVNQSYVKYGNEIRLAWDVTMDMSHNADHWIIHVDATNGAILNKHNYTVYCKVAPGMLNNQHRASCAHVHAPLAVQPPVVLDTSDASYRVYPLPAESPIHGSHDLITNPHLPQASPYGWHDVNGEDGPEFFITRGNNVHAYQDTNADDLSDNDEPRDSNLVFDFTHDTSLEPELNVDAAITNLFYMNNMMHDLTYLLGFDEVAGNFQDNNYGAPGNGGDHVNAEGLDGSGTDNANFSTPPDGGSGTMQMFIWGQSAGSARITEPTDLLGVLDVGVPSPDTWGFDYSTVDVSGKIVLAKDGNVQNPTTACGDLVNGDEVSGNIALIDRGLCQFGTKALNAQNSGAIAVIICNIAGVNGGDGETVIGMAGGNDGANVTIPTVSIKLSDCNRIKNSLTAGIDVVVNLNQQQLEGPEYLSASFDNGVIAHEYGHGISNRLTGGPSAAGCLGNEEQMGEGWSDFFTLIMTVQDGDKGSDPRGIGNYVNGDPVSGRGIRRFPFSTDFAVNSQTYDDIVGQGVHGTGEIWAGILWDIYWAFVDLYGWDADWTNTESGNFKAIQLVIDGMKFQACSPGFIEGRNAILAADETNHGGIHNCLLWEIFARRGVGFFADGGSSDSRSDGIEDFEPRPTCIKELKIKREVTDFIQPGESIGVLIEVANHKDSIAPSVQVTESIPDGLQYVDGSANIEPTINGSTLIFDLGDMASLQEETITFSLSSAPSNRSTRLFQNSNETVDDINQWDRQIIEGTNFWQINSFFAYSGLQSWIVNEFDGDSEQHLIYTSLQVDGNNPYLRLWHQYDMVAAQNGGFIEISTDGGTIWVDAREKFIRNGYASTITYTTFAIPSLEGFTGNSNGFIDSYIDLSEYAGQNISLRFRYGSIETGNNFAPDDGWIVDDVELLDLFTYETSACLTSSEETICTEDQRTIVDVDQTSSSEDLVLEGIDMTIYPNPANDFFTLHVQSDRNIQARLSILTMDGKQVHNQAMRIHKNDNYVNLDTKNYPPGFYIVQVNSGNRLMTEKLIIN